MGVAEQNLTSVSTGLALSGKVVFTYSIGNFNTLRCVEQLRNDVCYHKANVKIVSVGGGFTYGALGVTHHATEDLAIMRALPEMTVIAPGDPVEAALATQAIASYPGPCYLRLGKAGDPVVHPSTPAFQIGRAIMLRNGHDLTLISTGGMLDSAMKAADELGKQGITTRVLSMHTVKPIDAEAIIQSASETMAMLSVEEHNTTGGLGGAVAEVLAESGSRKIAFKRLGISGGFCREVGSQEYLRNIYSLSVKGIADEASQLFGTVGSRSR
jgi:transketolase